MMPMDPRARSARKGHWLTRNLGLKVASLTLSVLFYSWVHGSEDVRRSVDVDILVIPPSDASGRILTSEVPPRVRLTLHGSRSAINSMVSASLPPVELDLRRGDLDVYYFSEEQFDLPAGVSLTQMAPASIPLSWEQRVERGVPVEVETVGELRSGLVLTGPPVLVPNTLGVVGPESAVDGLGVLLTEPVNLATLREGTVERRLHVLGLPELTRFTGESQVSVTYRVGRNLETRTFRGLEVEPLNGTYRRARPSAVRIEVRGLREIIGDITPDQLVPVVDLEGVTPAIGSASVRVQVRGLPSGVEVVSVQPAEILVVR
ncbi:MAG: CdaR family protein [Polyangiales bacterium]|nr:YbbR-like domain-containing protein [Myxococcales bacterium]MCB9657176.1 YbbR-like domain-containing protein [Sandaracinaceae bacterium]